MDADDSARRREAMVAGQIEGRGIRDPLVRAAMRRVPRDAFVPADAQDRAYDDGPLPIADGQTISQPYIVALMLEAARLGPDDRVLEVGAGSGYASAVMAAIVRHVVAVERHPGLAAGARERLAALGLADVEVHVGDGSGGWPAAAPFDAIVVSAGGPRVPEVLRDQLADGGRLVMPVGPSTDDQRLVRITRLGPSDFRTDDLAGVAFVPLVGTHGWAPGD